VAAFGPALARSRYGSAIGSIFWPYDMCLWPSGQRRRRVAGRQNTRTPGRQDFAKRPSRSRPIPRDAQRVGHANLGRVSPSVHFEFEICDRDGRAALTCTIVIAIVASPCALVIGQIAFAKIQTSRTRPIFGLYRVTLWLANLITAFSNLGTRRSLR